jgi:Protein of unknown function (DUF3489)
VINRDDRRFGSRKELRNVSIHDDHDIRPALARAAKGRRMKTFIIDSTNIISAHDADVWVDEGCAKFQMEQELAALAATWASTRLVQIWNKLEGVKRVTKFTDRKTAVSRIWNAIQAIEPTVNATRKTKARSAAKKAKTPAAKEKSGGTSKTDLVLAALRSANGATLKQLMTLTGWQSHSVRGFLSAQVTKRMGFRVKSSKRDGERVYRVRS